MLYWAPLCGWGADGQPAELDRRSPPRRVPPIKLDRGDSADFASHGDLILLDEDASRPVALKTRGQN